MNRIHEVYKRTMLILPQAVAAPGNVSSAYTLIEADHDLHIHVAVDALLVGETAVVQVYKAKTAIGGSAAEITACATTFTAPAAGAANAEIVVSLDAATLGDGFKYILVKVTNTAAAGTVETYCDLITEAKYRGADVSTADELTVV